MRAVRASYHFYVDVGHGEGRGNDIAARYWKCYEEARRKNRPHRFPINVGVGDAVSKLSLRLTSVARTHGARNSPQMDSVGAARAAVLTRATSTARASSCRPGRRLAASYRAGFTPPHDPVVAGGRGHKGQITRLRALRGVRMRRAPRTSAVPPSVGAAPELKQARRVARGGGLLTPRDAARESQDKRSNFSREGRRDHVGVRAPVVRLVVLGFFPRRYSGNVVAPVGVARRRVVVARPLRRFIYETHLLLVFWGQVVMKQSR